MRGPWTVAVLVLLAAPAFVGCVGGPEEPPAMVAEQSTSSEGAVLEATDAADDGRMNGREFLQGSGRSACWVNAALAGPCYTGLYGAANAVPEDAGDPAPDALEIVGFTITETADELEVQLQLAGLDPSFEGAMSDTSWTIYEICWNDWLECTYAETVQTDDGPDLDWVTYNDYSDGCNTWDWCSYGVPIEVEFGAPATITWHVDRDLLSRSGTGTDLGEFNAGVVHHDYFTGSYAEADYMVTDPSDPQSRATFGGAGASSHYTVDRASEGPLVLDLGDSPTPGVEPWTTVQDEHGEHGMWGEAEPRPAVDMRAIEIIETPERLTIAITVEEVASDPEALAFLMLGLASGEVYDAWYDADDGTLAVESYVTDGSGPDGFREVPIDVDLRPGTPGTIRFTYDRNDLEPINAGDRTTLLQVYTWAEGEYAHEVDNAPAWAGLRLEPGTQWDDVVAAPYVFQYSSTGTSGGEDNGGSV